MLIWIVLDSERRVRLLEGVEVLSFTGVVVEVGDSFTSLVYSIVARGVAEL